MTEPYVGHRHVGVWRYPANEMAAYDFLCMACEHRFEHRRPMTASVETAIACPSCGSDRVRRQFSFLAGTASSGSSPHFTGGCACGGACACGG